MLYERESVHYQRAMGAPWHIEPLMGKEVVSLKTPVPDSTRETEVRR